MAYTDAEIQAFRDELAALRAARAKLNSGTLRARVGVDGDFVEYHRIHIPSMTQRIDELKSILSAIDNPGEHAISFRITSGKGL
ncbi:MAG: hypothetical protein KKI15_07640 [Proteobacteria bacterium]|nr:hypothetical protein [Pseudomonadota bacterium]